MRDEGAGAISGEAGGRALGRRREFLMWQINHEILTENASIERV